jgi:Flp pilus assembly protein TadB
MEDLQIDTITINSNKYVIFLIIFSFGSAGASLFLAIELHTFLIAAIGIACIFFGPLIFQKKFRSRFIKKATLRFSNDQLSIDLSNPRTNVMEAHADYKYAHINSFKAADSAKDDSAFIKLKLKNGRTIHYTFLEQGEKKRSKDVTEALAEFIHAYNSTRPNDTKIMPSSTFLASNKAKYYLIGLSVLLIVTIIFQISYKPNTVPMTLIGGVMFYLIILLQRKRDLDQYNRMKNDDE